MCRRCATRAIIVRNQGTIFLGGPPLVKAATGEVVSAEDLGGGDVHTRLSGVADHLAAERRACARHRAPHRRQSAIACKPRPSCLREAAARRATMPAELYGVVPPITRKPFDVREVIARIVDGSEFDEFKARLRHDAGLRLRAYPRHAGRHPRQQRHPVLGVGAEGRAFHRALLPARHPAASSCRTSPASWSGANTRTAASPRNGAKMVTAVATRAGAEVHGDHRRQFRRRQLRHVRPRLLAALPVDVAECAHLGDGRRAGGHRARHGQARRHRGQGRDAGARRRRKRSRRRSASNTRRQGHPYYATARLWDDGVIDPARDARACSALASRPRSTRRSPRPRFGVFRM